MTTNNAELYEKLIVAGEWVLDIYDNVRAPYRLRNFAPAKRNAEMVVALVKEARNVTELPLNSTDQAVKGALALQWFFSIFASRRPPYQKYMLEQAMNDIRFRLPQLQQALLDARGAMGALAECTTIFGPMKPEQHNRIRRFVENPSADTWTDIARIVIAAPLTTVWNAVIAQDPTFPRSGRVTDEAGSVVREWERIPTPLEVLRAIKAAAKGGAGMVKKGAVR